MMNKRLKYALLVAAVVVVLGGCGQKQMTNAGGQSPEPAPQTSVPVATETPAPTATPDPMKTKEVKVYYTDDDLTKLVEKTATVSYKEDADVYKAALEALKSTDQAGLNSLFKKVTFNSVKLDGKALRVDLTLGEGAQLGSGGELFFVEALNKAAFQFPEIEELYITQDGAKTESLMGHVDLQYPYKRK